MSRRYLVAGNWKMNGSRAENATLVDGILAGAPANTAVEILVCPPALYVESVGARLQGSAVQLGGQNLCDQEKPGAYTGEVHGGMLKDLGCGYVLVGHSERRAFYGDTDEVVARKYRTAQACGLVPVLCVGETLQEREAGQTEAVLQRQLAAVLDLCGVDSFAGAVIAYEPVWAIGTGKTATPEQAQEAHAFIRGQLRARNAKIADSTRILYGGSVKADNAQTLFANTDVDGGLIGGASLKAADFLAICAAAQILSKQGS
ncbi:MAG TPA: triose-phosphate isomerase [Solimonas sp.]|nr:triose-phosphate isomerase [Solimonas sp.]